MSDTEIVCLKCGYHNHPHRSNCKNCGEALTAEVAARQRIIVANRKKPLKQWEDWLRAAIGFLFFVFSLFGGVLAVDAAIHLSSVSLLFLMFSAGLFYGGLVLFLLPLYYLYIYQQGHNVTKGEIINSYEKEVSREDGSSHTDRYIVIDFVPEKARDPRSRRLTCKAISGIKIWSDNKKVLVYYALKDPNVILFEGEV